MKVKHRKLLKLIIIHSWLSLEHNKNKVPSNKHYQSKTTAFDDLFCNKLVDTKLKCHISFYCFIVMEHIKLHSVSWIYFVDNCLLSLSWIECWVYPWLRLPGAGGVIMLGTWTVGPVPEMYCSWKHDSHWYCESAKKLANLNIVLKIKIIILLLYCCTKLKSMPMCKWTTSTLKS